MVLLSDDDVPLLNKLLVYVGCLVFTILWPSSVERTASIGMDWGPPQVPFEDRFVNQLPVNANKVYYKGNGSCMPYARYRSGLPVFGSACTILTRLEESGLVRLDSPIAGAVIVTNEGNCGHIAYIEYVKDGMIHISEQNYEGGYIISERDIPIGSELIEGYVY